jgi:methylenetetrahydrofolate reductase (NADPH)
MEKITDKINSLPHGANYFSLEFFPPKTAMVGYPATSDN